MEDSNTGDDHFVIYKENNKWIVGFAERGSIHTKSSHQSKELARLEVINRIWHCLDTDLNPAHFKGGVNEGTMVDMPYSEEVIDKATKRIIEKYSLNDTEARDYAIKAIESLDSHGGNVNDIYEVYQVVETVVSSWIKK